MVAQIDEQQAAMIAFTVNPARQANGLVFVRQAKLATGMRAIGMHDVKSRKLLLIFRQKIARQGAHVTLFAASIQAMTDKFARYYK